MAESGVPSSPFALDLQSNGADELRRVVQKKLTAFSESFTDEVLSVSQAHEAVTMFLFFPLYQVHIFIADSLNLGEATVMCEWTNVPLKIVHPKRPPLRTWQEYVVVLVAHGKNKMQAAEDLDAFLSDQTTPFVDW